MLMLRNYLILSGIFEEFVIKKLVNMAVQVFFFF